MTKWKLNKFTMNEDVYIEERPSGAAPLGSKDFYEKVNPYWLDQAASAKRQELRSKRQAASRKHLTKIK